MSRNPHVEKGECIGCGVCVEILSAVFRFDEERKSEVYAPAGEPEVKIQEIMDLCPVACIRWKE